MATHELWFTTDEGVRIADLYHGSPLTKALRFSATRIVNGIGQIIVDLPAAAFDQSLLKRDSMIQLWRAPAGGAMRMFRPYFLRKWEYTFNSDGGEMLELTGLCVNDLLRRRVIAAATNRDGYADMGFESDDELRALVRQATTAAKDVISANSYSRGWDRLSVEVDTTTSDVVTISDMSFEPLLTLDGGGKLPKICKKSDALLYFDVVPVLVSASGIEFVFRAYVGQPGADRTDTGLVFSPDNGNLTDVAMTMDYTEEVNSVYAGKIGTMASQQVSEYSDEDAMRESAWNKCEGYTEDPNNAADVRDDSVSERFSGSIIQTASCIYGRDWDWGDRVQVRYRNYAREALIKAVALTVDERGAETVSANIDSGA